ncbi:MAG: hypothetical protein J6Y79_00490 [Paludibacteraceae bacterium]|nr:hypothetical protein [Paludibacteraceae bacterium]
MWVYIVTSFSRYRKVGVNARKKFETAVKKDGFHQMYDNLFVRYCTTSDNASLHKERVKKMIPAEGCNVSIIMVSDGQGSNAYHHLKRKRKPGGVYDKPSPVEFF